MKALNKLLQDKRVRVALIGAAIAVFTSLTGIECDPNTVEIIDDGYSRAVSGD